MIHLMEQLKIDNTMELQDIQYRMIQNMAVQYISPAIHLDRGVQVGSKKICMTI